MALVVAVCCGLATYGVHWIFVGTITGQSVDQFVLEQATAARVLHEPAASLLSGSVFAPLVVTSCLALVALALRRRAPWHAVAAALLVIGANATTQVLKLLVFDRPDLLQLGAPNSMPSGHTTVISSIALGLVLLAPPAMRIPAATVGLAGSLVVGAATVVMGWHRLSDVAAALLVSLAWAGTLFALLMLRPRRPAVVHAA